MRQDKRLKRRGSGVAESDQRSILWIVLLMGLIFSLGNVAMILSHVDSQQNESSDAAKIDLFRNQEAAQAAEAINGNVKDDKLDPLKDKEPILQLLREAGVSDLDHETIASLPTWTEVTRLYGDHPRIYGLDQCQVFQNMSEAPEHFVGTAGTFNSGTNLMSELLIHNCQMTARMKKYGNANKGIRWQVPWGKHHPPGDEQFRLNYKTEKDFNVDARNILPAVTIRDPYVWMRSMCRIQYKVWWPHNKDRHCPNLVPDEDDHKEFPTRLKGKDHVPVAVQYPEFVSKHDSLVHLWNDWYNEYADAKFPRLIVRFEDLIFHAKNVTETVCQCAGGEMKNHGFQYIVDSAKKGVGAHGKMEERTSMIQAIIRYGKDSSRLSGFKEEDLEFARKNLDPKLMEFFGYQHAPQKIQ